MKTFLFLMFIVLSSTIYGQNLTDLDSYNVDEFYKKLELDSGTLDEDGESIDYIFVKTELKEGFYEVELTDDKGDLYEIKGTEIYVTFTSYFGYAGYGKECYMKVSSSGYAIVYKKED